VGAAGAVPSTNSRCCTRAKEVSETLELAPRYAERAARPARIRGRRHCQHRAGQPRDEALFERRPQRQIHEQGGQSPERRLRLERQAEHLGAVGQPGPPQLGIVRIQDAPQIAGGPYAGQARFLERARKRAGKSGLLGDRVRTSPAARASW